MPNWVHQHLTITGSEQELDRLIAECFTDNSLDFDKLIPEPENIKESVRLNQKKIAGRMPASGMVQPDREGNGDTVFFPKATTVPLPREVIVPLRKLDSHFPDWYNWRCKNWGTKWNACAFDFERSPGQICLGFETAWSFPEPIYCLLAERFPSLRMVGSFGEEMGSFSGMITIAGGNLDIEDTSEATRAAWDAAYAEAEEAAKPSLKIVN